MNQSVSIQKETVRQYKSPPVLFSVNEPPIVTMNTYISNGRRHVINYLTKVKVGTQLVLFPMSD